jgi:hypothetical protein
MSQPRERPMARTTRTMLLDQGLTLVPPGGGTGMPAETWLRDGTVILMPLRTRLALIRPQMLKAQAGRARRH